MSQVAHIYPLSPSFLCLIEPSRISQLHRCRGSITFSLLSAWLLGAYSSDMHISTQRHSRGTKLRKLILSDELKPGHSHSSGPGLVHSEGSSADGECCYQLNLQGSCWETQSDETRLCLCSVLPLLPLCALAYLFF